MITKAKIISILFLLLTPAIAARAQERVSIRPTFNAGQEDRYVINASVDTLITPVGADGLTGSIRKEITATVLLRTEDATDKDYINRTAVIESIALRATENGVEVPSNVSTLAGQKIEFTVNLRGQLIKCSYPKGLAATGLAEMLFNMADWYPATDLTVGQNWQATGQGPLQSEKLSNISNSAITTYTLSSVKGGVASIDGVITHGQSAATGFTASLKQMEVSILASKQGNTRFAYDIAKGRITSGETEVQLQGKVLNVVASDKGQGSRSREGLIVETSKLSIKLVQ